MKKIFTFLAAAVLIASAAIAQNNNHQNHNEYDEEYDNNNPRNVTLDNDWRNRGKGKKYYYLTLRQRDMEIAQISREYNDRIQSVRHNFFMGRYKKQRIINTLQFQRDEEIRLVIERFNLKKNHHRKHDRWHQNRDNSNW